MQVQADWTQYYQDAKSIEDDLPEFTFSGPGLYLTESDTILIIPQPAEFPPTIDTVWQSSQPQETGYRVYVYNVPFSDTIFAAIAIAPVRQDSR